MHFIGNRAVILYNDEPHLRLAYSPVYTVLSVFVPIFVLLAAYLLCGTGENVAIVWTLVGGAFAGSRYVQRSLLSPRTFIAMRSTKSKTPFHILPAYFWPFRRYPFTTFYTARLLIFQ